MGTDRSFRFVRFLFFAFVLTSSLPDSRWLAAEENHPVRGDSRIIVTVSVDWEGFPLDEKNVEAIERFRNEYATIPLTHFLNAANYCRDEAADSVTETIRRVVRKDDETGVHIHCWRSLIQAAGVPYREGPTFWGNHIPLRRYPFGDAGHEVQLSAYTSEEVTEIARKSVTVLRDNGFSISKSFRAAGWVADADVLNGIANAGFKIDSSATDRGWTKAELAEFDIYRRLGEVWPNVTPHTQPYVIQTDSGELLEMPDTAAMADYVTPEEMDLHLKEAYAKAELGETRFVHLGFHFETATRFLPRVAQTVAKWESNERVHFMTLTQAASVVAESGREVP